MAIDLGRPYRSNQLELMVAQLSPNGSRKDFVRQLAEQLGEAARRAPWAATRVPAIRP